MTRVEVMAEKHLEEMCIKCIDLYIVNECRELLS